MQMTQQVKIENEQIMNTNGANKGRSGRWTQKEAYLFQTLLQRYGKNWKKIQQHMKHRSLAQIRSHAQKYFEKIGPKKVEEFQRRAKLLQAYQTLKNQNCLKSELSKLQQAPKQQEKDLKQNDQQQVASEKPLGKLKTLSNQESSLQNLKVQATEITSFRQAPNSYAPNIALPYNIFDQHMYCQALVQMHHQYLLSNYFGVQ